MEAGFERMAVEFLKAAPKEALAMIHSLTPETVKEITSNAEIRHLIEIAKEDSATKRGCIICGKVYKIDKNCTDTKYLRIHGNIYVGETGGIVGNNFPIDLIEYRDDDRFTTTDVRSTYCEKDYRKLILWCSTS